MDWRCSDDAGAIGRERIEELKPMYANQEKNEYYAMVDRVRKHFGSAVEIGGYNSHDIKKLRQRDKQREAHELRAIEERPLTEASGRQRVVYERAIKAWRAIEERQDTLKKNHRVHTVNGFDQDLLAPVEMPKRPDCSTVDEYDLSTAEISQTATELEIRPANCGAISPLGKVRRRTSKTGC